MATTVGKFRFERGSEPRRNDEDRFHQGLRPVAIRKAAGF
jgi:methyl-accepting chemotaxis protein